MDRNTVLPSGREVGDYLYNLSRIGYKKAKSIVRTLLSGYSLNFNEGFEGLACMNHKAKTIIVNPLVYLSGIDPMLDKLQESHPRNYYDIFQKALTWGLVGVVCHEIGHALYTISPDEAEPFIKSCKVPDFFVHFCSNVVEDSFIQNKMKQRFKWDLLRDGIDTSTAIFQGHTTCEEFSKKESFTAKDKMFYFILRSYNPSFAPPTGCDIPEDLIEEFLSFYFLESTKDRFLYTVDWSVKVYDWLKEEIQNDEDQMQQQQQGQGQGQGGSGQGSQQSGQGNSQGQNQGSSSGKSKGVGAGAKKSQDEIAQAIKDLVDSISKQTGIGSGEDKTEGSFNPNSFNNDTLTDNVGICNGIFRVHSGGTTELGETAKHMLSSYNLNFRRLQVHSFNGIAYNQSSGRLYQNKIYKSSLTPKIFTREIGRKREMDLYFGVTLDASGSMDDVYYTLVDIIVPLLHSLEGIHSKSEMLVFSDDTVKVKDYYDHNVRALYSDVLSSNMGNGTDLLPSLQYFSSVIRERQHKDKCIIVVTDGQTGNAQKCAEQIRALRKFNTCVVGIGLKLGDDPRWFRDLFGDDVLLYPTDEAIQNNIAKDLIDYLSSKFMRR